MRVRVNGRSLAWRFPTVNDDQPSTAAIAITQTVRVKKSITRHDELAHRRRRDSVEVARAVTDVGRHA